MITIIIIFTISGVSIFKVTKSKKGNKISPRHFSEDPDWNNGISPHTGQHWTLSHIDANTVIHTDTKGNQIKSNNY